MFFTFIGLHPPLWHKQLIITFYCRASRVGEESRHNLLCAPRSLSRDSLSGRVPPRAQQRSAGQTGYGDNPWDVNPSSCPMSHRSVPGCCTRAAAPRAFCCSAPAGAFPRYLILLSPPEPPSAFFLWVMLPFESHACNRSQWQRLQPDGVWKAEDALNRCRAQAGWHTARQHGSLTFLLQEICTEIRLPGKTLLRQWKGRRDHMHFTKSVFPSCSFTHSLNTP